MSGEIGVSARLLATIFEIPPALQERSGRAVVQVLANQAINSKRWCLKTSGRFHALIPAGAQWSGTGPLAGTPILHLEADVALRRVLVGWGAMKADAGHFMPSRTPIANRVHQALQFATDCGLAPYPNVAGFSEREVLPGLRNRRRGLVQVETPVQLVMVDCADDPTRALNMRGQIEPRLGHAPCGSHFPRGVKLHKEILTLTRALELARCTPASDAQRERRSRTVMLLLLPPRHIEITAEGSLFRQIFELSRQRIPFECMTDRVLSSAAAFNNLVHDVALASGGAEDPIPHSFDGEVLIGVDASHSRDRDESHWACVALDPRGRLQAVAVRKARRDESLRQCATSGALKVVLDHLASEIRPKKVLIHRDGKEFAEDFSFVEAAVGGRFSLALVPVSKHPGLLLYKKDGDVISEPHFGDALVADSGDCAYVCTSATSGKQAVNPLKVGRPRGTNLNQALEDLVAACELQKPGLYMESPLPATSYWADRFSKQSVGEQLRIIGRGARCVLQH